MLENCRSHLDETCPLRKLPLARWMIAALALGALPLSPGKDCFRSIKATRSFAAADESVTKVDAALNSTMPGLPLSTPLKNTFESTSILQSLEYPPAKVTDVLFSELLRLLYITDDIVVLGHGVSRCRTISRQLPSRPRLGEEQLNEALLK